MTNETGVVNCAICNNPITEEDLAFHREELCKIPIREEFKEYLLKKGFLLENILRCYKKALLKYKNLTDSRQTTVEVYTRDSLRME